MSCCGGCATGAGCQTEIGCTGGACAVPPPPALAFGAPIFIPGAPSFAGPLPGFPAPFMPGLPGLTGLPPRAFKQSKTGCKSCGGKNKPPPSAPTVGAAILGNATCRSAECNVYVSPNFYNYKSKLGRGDRVNVLSASGGWSHVRYANGTQDGWIPTAFLTSPTTPASPGKLGRVRTGQFSFPTPNLADVNRFIDMLQSRLLDQRAIGTPPSSAPAPAPAPAPATAPAPAAPAKPHWPIGMVCISGCTFYQPDDVSQSWPIPAGERVTAWPTDPEGRWKQPGKFFVRLSNGDIGWMDPPQLSDAPTTGQLRRPRTGQLASDQAYSAYENAVRKGHTPKTTSQLYRAYVAANAKEGGRGPMGPMGAIGPSGPRPFIALRPKRPWPGQPQTGAVPDYVLQLYRDWQNAIAAGESGEQLARRWQSYDEAYRSEYGAAPPLTGEPGPPPLGRCRGQRCIILSPDLTQYAYLTPTSTFAMAFSAPDGTAVPIRDPNGGQRSLVYITLRDGSNIEAWVHPDFVEFLPAEAQLPV